MLRQLLLRLYERLALNAMATGDYGRAERMLRKMEGYEGRTRRVLHNLAVVRMGLGDYADAEKLLFAEIDAYGAAPALLRALAEAGYLSGNRDRAASHLRTALADTGCPDRELLKRRATICADPALYEAAMAGKRAFAEGTRLRDGGDPDGAITAFRRAADADPTDFIALNNLGTLLLNHAKDTAGAIRAFEQASMVSDQPFLRANLAAAREAATRPR